jgi:hypothetical protein
VLQIIAIDIMLGGDNAALEPFGFCHWASSSLTSPNLIEWPISGRHFAEMKFGFGHAEVRQERLLTGNELGPP